jgi:hypothetical protein
LKKARAYRDLSKQDYYLKEDPAKPHKSKYGVEIFNACIDELRNEIKNHRVFNQAEKEEVMKIAHDTFKGMYFDDKIIYARNLIDFLPINFPFNACSNACSCLFDIFISYPIYFVWFAFLTSIVSLCPHPPSEFNGPNRFNRKLSEGNVHINEQEKAKKKDKKKK